MTSINKTPEEILFELSKKFDNNRKSWNKLNHPDLSKLFIFASAISEIGQILQRGNPSPHQKRCCTIFDEVFSDMISGIYLATCAVNKPAHIILRRIIELGIAVVYLWDMPHVRCSWEYYDEDLSFSEMLKHINSDGFKKHVSESLDKPIEKHIADPIIFRKYYAQLSNIVHGKFSSFESNLPNRFSFIEKDWNDYFSIALIIAESLLDTYYKRFPIQELIEKKFPALKRG